MASFQTLLGLIPVLWAQKVLAKRYFRCFLDLLNLSIHIEYIECTVVDEHFRTSNGFRYHKSTPLVVSHKNTSLKTITY